MGVELRDWYLIFALIAVLIILLVLNTYILVYFTHPDDKNEAWAAKVLIVLGFTLAQGTIILMTLDVANHSNSVGCQQGWNRLCGSLNMYMFWQFIYGAIWVLCCFVIPFAIFFYEEDDGFGNKDKNRLCTAIQWEICVAFVSLLILLPLYFIVGVTKVPVVSTAASVSQFTPFAVTSIYGASGGLSTTELSNAAALIATSTTVKFKVTFIVYVAALMSFIGWFLFVLFAGIGLGALPVDLILDFVHRPTPQEGSQIQETTKLLRQRTKELIEAGELLKRERQAAYESNQNFLKRAARQRRDRRAVNKFRQNITLLEWDYEVLDNCKTYYENNNFIIAYIKLFFGILGCIITGLWVVHIIIYMLFNPPRNYFLNTYFIWFDKWFPLFGALSVMLMTLYLLMCAMHGCFKFGVRFFFIPIHPMKRNGTYLNSFLFNLGVVLMCTLPTVQFSIQAFGQYAQYTSVSQITGVQIKYMQGFSAFFAHNIFIIALLIMIGLSVIVLILKPRDRPASCDDIKSAALMNY